MAYDLDLAHKDAKDNMPSLKNDTLCGCFNCLRIYAPSEIEQYVKDTLGTAICPYCKVDSVIGASSGFPITKEFLQKMRDHWF